VEPGGDKQITPLRKAHQLLRGRYVLALILAGVCGIAGAGAGFISQRPAYKSDGLIEVKPIIPDIDSYDRVMLMYGTHMQSQVAWLKSERLIRFALDRPEWKNVKPDFGPDMAFAFNQNLTVTYLKNTPLIQVTYSDPDPKVAPVAVRAVINTYKERFSGEHLKTTNRKIEHWESSKDECRRGIEADKRAIEELAAPYGYDDLSTLLNSQLSEQIRLDALVRDAEMDFTAARESKPAPMSIEDIARVDPTMEQHKRIRDDLELQVEQSLFTLGANHPNVKRMQNQLQVRTTLLEKYADEFRTKYSGVRVASDGRPNNLVPADPGVLQQSLDRLKRFAESERKKTASLGQTFRKIQNAKGEINELSLRLKEAEDQIEKLNFQKSMVGELNVISDGSTAAQDKDKRIQLAAIGLLGGGMLPVGLMLVVGLLDGRYRYSDEATGVENPGGARLLGILPNLPDRLSDPEQAAIAAHCVHQVRTMLQINGGVGGVTDSRRVIAVTSASPGDGKTSLTLALGLSYAACGTRTLLIDCDLVGAGLTHRMNVNATEGVLEAIGNRSLLTYVRPTEIDNVSILPVGAAQAHHAGTLSPAGLRRLIEEAEQNFDTILIDTGPLLGSIEAPLVCSAADRVVLTISRGQQRPLVERSISHLAAIGARLAGIVFNRAEQSDFARSISGMSVRSFSERPHRAAATVASGERIGPVARAVARSRGDDRGNIG
jgi:Mrp family chromosome partitioning ATPase/uncharacterized protein involved in exopolysaccharide biosynthesis